uniref:Metallo-beta-lactamase domain-containing protein n=1 Tax=Ciona savignyi TaxID=51511 RepID=H2YQ81_CIOSA
MFQGNARVIKVTEGVYVARQFSLANMAMIEGSDGIIIIDSTASSDSALKVLEAFRNITDKPIKAIILTHFHPDHISGLNSILQSTNDHIDVYSHLLTKEELSKSLVTKQGTAKRTARQFGMLLPSTVLPDIVFTAVHPTYTYEEHLTVHIAGIKVELIHTPGETEDHTSIFLPEKNVLFPGDNLYESFPNIYPVRGEIRDVKQWISSLDHVRYLNVTYLAPSHITPVIGKE